MKLIAFDTQILIWGVQGSSRPSQRGMIPRTRSLIEEVAKQQTKRQTELVIPLPAAVEYVCGFPVDDQARQWATLSSRFRLIPFDLRAAQIASQIERRRSDLKPKKTKKKTSRKRTASRRTAADIARQKVKVDVQIIATAIAAGASSIYSDETKHFAELAAGFKIQVLDVRSHEFQPRLPNAD